MDPDVNSSAANVQHVAKKSSDELLRKFAQVDDEDDGFESKKEHPAKVSSRRKRRRTSRREEGDASSESPSHYSGAAILVERRSLLAPVARKSAFLSQLGIGGAGRSPLRARDIKNKSVLAAIRKTWRKTMQGASNVLLEKRYGRHRRLINDVI